MAANGSISLNLLVDKENNRVIFAEAEKDFVDVLCSFLTLPIGTVVRRVCKESVIGCMNNLYKSVEDLGIHYFQNATCKEMLLRTRNSSANVCRNLKVNIDDTELTKFYICSGYSTSHVSQGLSTFFKVNCSCGSTTSVKVSSDSTVAGQVSEDGEVFIQGEASFLVTDDLQIIPMSTDLQIIPMSTEATCDLLNNLGVQVSEALESKSVTINLNEVSHLLKNALCSTTALTNTFLMEPKDVFSHSVSKLSCNIYSTVKAETTSDVKNISLKIICRKSTQIPIYAEAGCDFVSFLFSMLSFPLGAVVKLMNLAPSLGSVTNLYKSVAQLNVDQYIKSEDHKQMLVSPKLALQYGCKDQLLDITEVEHPPWFYNYKCSRGYVMRTLSTQKYYGSRSAIPYDGTYSENADFLQLANYMKGEKLFMVTDDLVVTPFSSIACITFFKQLKMPINDLEPRVVSIGQREALQILESSMTSDSVLTSILKWAALKIPKQEKC